MEGGERQVSDELDTATQRLLDEVRLLSEAELRAASLVPGWSRAHVLAHLARGADATRGLLIGARAGRDLQAYPSYQARDAAINASAAARAEDLKADVADSAMALRTVARQLPDQAWSYQVLGLSGTRFPASQLLVRRLTEVELHHCDLGIGYGGDRWLAAFGAMDLDEPMRSQRAERLGYVQPESVRAKSMARKTPAYQPGRPLPGSWLGTR